MINRFKKGPRHLVEHLNQLVDTVNILTKTTGGGAGFALQTLQGRVNSVNIDQINPRIPRAKFPASSPVKYYKVYRVVGNAAGDAVYNCYEQSLDSTDWGDTSGLNKFYDANATTVTIYNLAEFDPESELVRHLAVNDLMISWEFVDDETNTRRVGIPFRAGAHGAGTRLAYMKADASTGSTATCYLDKDDTNSTEITVNFNLAQGEADLQDCSPLLLDGDRICVVKIGANWYCTAVFNPSKECACS